MSTGEVVFYSSMSTLIGVAFGYALARIVDRIRLAFAPRWICRDCGQTAYIPTAKEVRETVCAACDRIHELAT